MRKTINQTHIEGYIYEHKLENRVTGDNSKHPGTEYITGTLDIATDNAITNIVSVHYTYVTSTTGKGNPNNTYDVLKGIIDGRYKTVMSHGKEMANKVRIDSSIGLNDWYTNRSGVEELVSTKRNEGGFIHVIDALNENESERNTFTVDMIITNVTRSEANEERNIPERVTVRGCVFDFRNGVLPVDFVATNPGAMDYFESLEATSKHPVFTKLWGKQISQTVVRTYTEESAFGDASVRTVPSTRREWLITGAAKETYTFGGEDDDMSEAALVKGMADRETYLATIKSRREAYLASRGEATTEAPKSSNGVFNF